MGARGPMAAAGLVVGAMALIGLIDNFMRVAAATGGLWQFHLLRGILALPILVAVAWGLGASLRARRPGRVLARSFLNSVAMVTYFGCLAVLPIAEVVAGLFTAPLFVALFSAAIWGERVGAARMGAVALGFAGVLVALGIDAGDLSALALLPAAAGALYGLGNLLTRKWCAEEGTLALVAWSFGLLLAWGAAGSLLLWAVPLPAPAGPAGFVTRGWTAPQPAFLAVVAVQAVGSLVAVGALIRAYQIADATLVAVLENSLLVFATLWAALIWGEAPEARQVVGLVLVGAAGALVALLPPGRAAAVPAEP